MAISRRIPPDRELNTRMFLTGLLMVVLYALFVGALWYFLRSVILVVVIAGGFLFVQYWFSDKIALFGMNGHVVTPEQEPELHAVVDRLCALADMKKPRVAVAEVDMPNAFATGRNPSNAVVCATRGIMRRLSEPELEAVLAHELSHVAHRDVAVMTIASFLGMVAGLITRFTLYAGMFGGFGDERGNDNAALVELAVIAVSAAVYAISFLLTMALSRYRELAADRSGAILIGRPSLLASALVKVTGELGRIPTRDLRTAEHFNAFFFTPALAKGASISSLFSTHPPLQKRLDQLARLEAEMSGPAA
ncbi:MAG: zinc metalloprotease HtpX [Acidobacteriota bacterium]|nr:zinc metalloprotease HtpX [Acidobacteriota bacterium]